MARDRNADIVDKLTDQLEAAVADLPLDDYAAVLEGLAAEVRRQQEAVVVDQRRAKDRQADAPAEDDADLDRWMDRHLS